MSHYLSVKLYMYNQSHLCAYYRLCLPEGVNDGTSALTDHLVVPLPCIRVDRLTHSSQNPQAGEVVPNRKANGL